MLTILIFSLLASVPHHGVDAVTQVSLRSYQDDAYGIEVDIGTPIQSLHLGVDLYGTGVAVAGAACVQCCYKDQTYDPTKSTSNTKNCSAPLDKGDGTAQATCHDILSALDFRNPDYVFSEVTTATHGSAFVQNVWDGTFGLNQASLIEQPFGFFMKRTCTNATVDNAGTITHGGIDEQNCNAAGASIPLTTK
ncbi:proteinase A [Aphelenchoides avenae]|nr:proteinase A [Aphelenchus avenae]